MSAPRRLFAAIAAASAVTIADAGPIFLGGLGGDKNPSLVDTFNVYGSCGASVIQIIGVDKSKWKAAENFFAFEDSAGSGVYVIHSGRSIKVETADHNTVICRPVAGTKEFRLFVGSTCAGSACPDAMNYKVIDPGRLAIISPAQCDEACARALLRDKR